MKALVRSLLDRFGYTLFNSRRYHSRDGLFTLHGARFLHDPRFQAAYARGVRASRGVDPHFEWRVHIALWAAEQAERIPGDFVECGVNAGFVSSAILHHLRLEDRRFFLVDTFDGPVLTQFSEEEVRHGRRAFAEQALAAGSYVTDLDRIAQNFAEWPNARIVQGVIPEILPHVHVERIAFLHIDLNCAAPECAALEYFWSRLPTGALVLLDDYAYFGHEEQASAMEQTARKLGAEILCLPTGQGMIRRN